MKNGKIAWKVDWIEHYLQPAELALPKILVSRLPQNTSNVNIESTGKSKFTYVIKFFEP